MEDLGRTVLIGAILLVLVVFTASWLLCAGLSDIVHWTYCQDVLALVQHLAQATLSGVEQLRDVLGAPWLRASPHTGASPGQHRGLTTGG
jgi:hypothetical protein